jgi:hypothetical protein
MTEEERAEILVTARLLEAAGKLDVLSIGLTLLAAFFVVDRPGWPVAMSLASGLAARWLSLRVVFDARLLRDVAAATLATAQLDDALVSLRLMPRDKAGREWRARCRGAKRLVTLFGLATAAQCVLLAL